MTITTTSTKAVAQGNAATTVWPFTFLIPTLTDVVVTLVLISSGDETELAPAAYTVSGLGSDAGGTVTYPLSGSPLAATYKIVIERLLPLLQETDLVNQGGAYPADIEDALDYLTMATQQIQDQLDRSIVFSIADTGSDGTLPIASARANLFLGFDADGDPTCLDGLTAGTTVSAAMIPVVTASTTADALIALGLSGGSILDAIIPAGTLWDYTLTTAPTGFVFPIGQACTPTYPVYRAALVAASSPFGTNGVDPLMPDMRSVVSAGKSNMGGVDNGLLTGGTVLGAVLSTQTKTLVAANLPPHTHTGTTDLNNADHSHTYQRTDVTLGGVQGGGTFPVGVVAVNQPTVSTSGASIGHAHVYTTSNGPGTSTPVSVVQPTFICNKILKVH